MGREQLFKQLLIEKQQLLKILDGVPAFAEEKPVFFTDVTRYISAVMDHWGNIKYVKDNEQDKVAKNEDLLKRHLPILLEKTAYCLQYGKSESLWYTCKGGARDKLLEIQTLATELVRLGNAPDSPASTASVNPAVSSASDSPPTRQTPPPPQYS